MGVDIYNPSQLCLKRQATKSVAMTELAKSSVKDEVPAHVEAKAVVFGEPWRKNKKH